MLLHWFSLKFGIFSRLRRERDRVKALVGDLGREMTKVEKKKSEEEAKEQQEGETDLMAEV